MNVEKMRRTVDRNESTYRLRYLATYHPAALSPAFPSLVALVAGMRSIRFPTIRVERETMQG